MPTHKIFKQRVRARMTKTGESYTAARRQLHHKAGEPPIDPGTVDAAAVEPRNAVDLLVSDEAVRRATGKDHDEWFALLDGWGAAERSHPEIARWLKDVQGVPPWWTQNVTVAYERARGMRGRHQMADGFSISVTRTIAADPDRLVAAFIEPAIRRRWLPAALKPRPTRAARTARFDWSEPPSRLVVTVTPKAAGKSVVAVAHGQLPDAAAAQTLKAEWRTWLGALKEVMEAV